MVEFVYNNKIHMATKISPFKANYGQDPRMEFEGERRRKYEVAGKFAKRIKKIQEEVKVVLGKAQEEMKKFANRRRREEEEYRVGDLVLLSTKDLKWQMKERRSEKLTEHFVGPYKVKGIVSSNVIELELPKSIKVLLSRGSECLSDHPRWMFEKNSIEFFVGLQPYLYYCYSGYTLKSHDHLLFPECSMVT